MEELKKYIKENKTKESFYYTGLKERSLESKFQFIKNHFQYDIMNSWNNLKTIANNVKVYNFLNNEEFQKYFELLEIDEDFIYYNTIYIIEDFEALTGLKVYTNGRSGGYLILCNENNNYNIINNFIDSDILKYSENLKEFKEDFEKYEYKEINENINNLYYLIKSFDLFCDILVSEIKILINNATIEEKEEEIKRTYKEIII